MEGGLTKLMLSFLFLFLLCLFRMDIVQAAHKFRYCSGDDYEVKVENVTISPDHIDYIDYTKPWTLTVAATIAEGSDFTLLNERLSTFVVAGDNKRYEVENIFFCSKMTGPSSFVFSHTHMVDNNDHQNPKAISLFIWDGKKPTPKVYTCIDVCLDTGCVNLDVKKMGRKYLPAK